VPPSSMQVTSLFVCYNFLEWVESNSLAVTCVSSSKSLRYPMPRLSLVYDDVTRFWIILSFLAFD